MQQRNTKVCRATESGNAVNTELEDIDLRLKDAVHQLREQESLVPVLDNEYTERGVLLSLLSSVLRQFYFLQKYRKAVLKSLGL